MPRESRAVYLVRNQPQKPFPKRPLFVLLGIALAAIFGVGAWYILGLPALTVTEIDVSGTDIVPAEEVRQAVQKMLSGRMGFIVPRSNFFAVSGGRVEKELRRQFSEVALAEVNKEFPHRLVIRVEGRKLWGVYCERSPAAETRSCAYLDGEGTAYDELGNFSGWLLPLIYGSSAVRLGEPTVPKTALGFFEQAKTELAALGAHLLSLAFSTTTPDEVRLGLAEGWHIRVTFSRPIGEWLGILQAVLEKEVGARRAELDYIDLRLGSKVFYKFKQ